MEALFFMKNISLKEKISSTLGIISFLIPIILFSLIILHMLLYNSMPYGEKSLRMLLFQILDNRLYISILSPIYISPCGIFVGFISIFICSNRFGPMGIISNLLMFLFPFIVWPLTVIIWGP